jgi:hypothetical protein
MKHQECTRPRYLLVLLCALLVGTAAMTGCKNAEAAKAEHVRRGEAFLKEEKFQPYR